MEFNTEIPEMELVTLDEDCLGSLFRGDQDSLLAFARILADQTGLEVVVGWPTNTSAVSEEAWNQALDEHSEKFPEDWA